MSEEEKIKTTSDHKSTKQEASHNAAAKAIEELGRLTVYNELIMV